MKQIVLILVAVMLVFGLSCGCSKKKQAQEPNQPATAKQATPAQMAPAPVEQMTPPEVDADLETDTNDQMFDEPIHEITETDSVEEPQEQ